MGNGGQSGNRGRTGNGTRTGNRGRSENHGRVGKYDQYFARFAHIHGEKWRSPRGLASGVADGRRTPGCARNSMDVKAMNDRTNRRKMKRWLQGLGLAYVLLLLGLFPWIQNPEDPERTVHGQVTTEPNAAGDDAKETQGDAGQVEDDGGQTRGDTSQAQEDGRPGEDAGQVKNDGGQTGERPKIALTFDDGPNAKWTPVLLDGLKERSVKATFFLIGVNIEKDGNDEIVRRMQEEGHLIGNHTYHHVEITKVSDKAALKELATTNDLISDITGEPVEYMRPPFGAWQKPLEEKLHVLPVLWTVDPLDWKTDDVDKVVERVVKDVEENDIILLHDCYESSVEAALKIIDVLTEQGYEFVTVDELILD